MLTCRLAERAFQKIVLQRQLADLRVQRFDVDRRFRGSRRLAEYAGGAGQKLILPAYAGDASAALVLPGMLDLPEGLVQVTGVYRADRTSPTEGLFIPLGRIDPLLSAERRRTYSEQLERCREEDCQLDYRLGNGVVPGVTSRKE